MAPALIQEVEDEPSVPTTLELTAVETTLRLLLLDVAKYVDQNPHSDKVESQVQLPQDLAKQPLVLRFTGGWVRDRLLGVDSHDIDVAINKMTGYQFGLRMKEYLEIPGHPEKYGLEGVATTDKQSQKAGVTDKSRTVGGLHKIEANPEKSKHLETVTTRILGLDIDLVNLRKETYTDDSRNPQMEFGTPEEDALRRDATINAIFYNLNSQEVEDFTGRGHADMRDHIIRTPLEPYQTFKDDPLRILRLIRFASRLDYAIDSDTLHAMRDSEIKHALQRKISRERVGIELEKALRGPDPHEALRLIFDLGLYTTVFSDPTVDSSKQYTPEVAGWQPLIDHLEALLDSGNSLSDVLVRDDDERFLAWQLAALVPYRDAPTPDPPEPGRRARPPISASVAREGIKATNRVCEVVTASVRHQTEVSSLVDRVYQHKRRHGRGAEGEDPTARDVLGMTIRRWGPTWRSQVLYSLLVDIVEQPDSTDVTRRRYSVFLEQLRDLDVLEAYQLKPLLDGKTLAKALDTPPGPWMKDALDVVMAWQLRHPDEKSAEAAVQEVKTQHQQQQQQHGELASSLAQHFLTLTVRPLFLKAKPDSLTDQARKNAMPTLPAKVTALGDSVTKPWKSSSEAHALDLLKWAVTGQGERSIERMWPLIVPPLLTLVDDWEIKYKILGSDLLRHILRVTPPELLERTGLGSVFEDALLPCLTYLPTLTPEDESTALLSSVYPTLLTLSTTRFPERLSASDRRSADEIEFERVRFLDTIVRKGVIYGYSHVSHHAGVVAVLFRQLALLVELLGIESVKHLKYLLPMLTETLSHPLAAAHVESLHSAMRSMTAVILSCWPRMVVHRGEVLKGLTLCWLALDGRESEETDALRRGMRENVALLKAAVGSQVDFDGECSSLIAADARLAGLLASE